MLFFKVEALLFLTLATQFIAAQTNWPSIISQLELDTSESPVSAVLPPDVVVQAPASNIAADTARFALV